SSTSGSSGPAAVRRRGRCASPWRAPAGYPSRQPRLPLRAVRGSRLRAGRTLRPLPVESRSAACGGCRGSRRQRGRRSAVPGGCARSRRAPPPRRRPGRPARSAIPSIRPAATTTTTPRPGKAPRPRQSTGEGRTGCFGTRSASAGAAGVASKHRAGPRRAEAVCDETPETPTKPAPRGGNAAMPRYPAPDRPEDRMRQTARSRFARAACVLALSVAACMPAAMAAPQDAATAEAASPAVAKLQALYTDEWKWRQREFAYEHVNGGWQPSDHFRSAAPAAWARRAAYWRQVLARLDAVPVDALPHEERVNAAVFRADVEAMLNNAEWCTCEAPFNGDSFFWGYLNPSQPYRSEADWQRFIGRLRDLPRYFDEHIANMEAGLARGWSVPRVSIEGRDRTLEPYTLAGDGNPFLDTIARMPDTIPAPVRARLQ